MEQACRINKLPFGETEVDRLEGWSMGYDPARRTNKAAESGNLMLLLKSGHRSIESRQDFGSPRVGHPRCIKFKIHTCVSVIG